MYHETWQFSAAITAPKKIRAWLYAIVLFLCLKEKPEIEEETAAHSPSKI